MWTNCIKKIMLYIATMDIGLSIDLICGLKNGAGGWKADLKIR